MKIGMGEFYSYRGKGRDFSTYSARHLFLEGVNYHAPEVLVKLKKQVYPEYLKLIPKKDDLKLKDLPCDLNWDYIKNASGDWYVHLVPLKEALHAWADEFNVLNEEWILELAVDTLSLWIFFRPKKDPYWGSLSATGTNPIPKIKREINFKHPGWDPIRKTWTEAKKKLLQDFEKFLEQDYRVKVEYLAEGAGLARTPDKRQMERHMRWLVHFCINGHSYKQICAIEAGREEYAKKDPPGEDTIIKAINNTAELVGINLARSKR